MIRLPALVVLLLIFPVDNPSVAPVCYFMWNLSVLRSMELHSIRFVESPTIHAAGRQRPERLGK